ncbi:unnamed protein product, partial [Allacma fusca]
MFFVNCLLFLEKTQKALLREVEFMSGKLSIRKKELEQ